MIIYKVENKINGEIYIGQTKKDLSERIAGHILNKKSYFSRALGKYGLESFLISVIDEAEIREILNEKEKYWIKFYNCRVPYGYNLTSGGEGNDSPTSDETKKKQSESHKGKVSGMLGKHQPESAKEKLRKPRSEEFKQKLRVPMSEERKRNLKIAHNTPESKEKSRESHLNKHYSEETKYKMKVSQKLRRLKEKKAKLVT